MSKLFDRMYSYRDKESGWYIIESPFWLLSEVVHEVLA